jgi:transcriptional regulator with XRE-family HTH domain
MNGGNTNVLLLLTSAGSSGTIRKDQESKKMNDNSVFYRKVGERIRAKRVERGLSQEGLAKAIGLKRPSMGNIEKGRQNILLHTFCEIAETLDTDAGALLPERLTTEPVNMPDLHALSKEVREFVEAGIKTTKKGR